MTVMRKSKLRPYLFLAPYYLLFFIFVVVPVLVAIVLSFTHFDTIQFPSFAGLLSLIHI